MLLEIDTNALLIGLASANLALGLFRAIQDYRTFKQLKWLVDVLKREAAYERV